LSRFDVTLVGEANLDLVLYGLPGDLPTDRELVANDIALTLGGSPAITAHNLAALGSRTGFVTLASNDLFGSMCHRDLTAAGVDLSRVMKKTGTAGTGVSVLLQHPSSRRTLTYPGNTIDLKLEDLDLEYLANATHFHLSSYFLQKGLRQDVPRLFVDLKRAGLTISVDPNDDPLGAWDDSFFEILKFVDVLMPNEREVCEMMRDSDANCAMRRLAKLVPLLVVKRGSRGAVAITGDQTFDSASVDVETVDAIGAGDSFNSGFLHGFVRRWPLDRCLYFGNLTGAFSTTAAGGVQAFRDRIRLDKFLSGHLRFQTPASTIGTKT
jgi:sugar/nucleoside kinase (ribokinase family)